MVKEIISEAPRRVYITNHKLNFETCTYTFFSFKYFQVKFLTTWYTRSWRLLGTLLFLLGLLVSATAHQDGVVVLDE